MLFQQKDSADANSGKSEKDVDKEATVDVFSIIRPKQKKMCVSSDPIHPKFLLRPYKFLLPLSMLRTKSGRKTTTLVRDLEYFIHTKFHQNLSSSSGEEVDNVNSLTGDRQTDGRRTTHDHNRSLEPLTPVP